MGVVLRSLCNGGSGDGPIEILTTKTDFNVITVEGPRGPMEAPANSLVVFTAFSFRELLHDSVPCDVWEFRVQSATKPGAPPTWAMLYLAGVDIFLIRTPSKVAV